MPNAAPLTEHWQTPDAGNRTRSRRLSSKEKATWSCP